MQGGTAKAVLVISGMRNNACRERVAGCLGRVKGVRDVSVSLIRAQAEVEFGPPCDAAKLVIAVVNAGYRAELVWCEGTPAQRS